ncbi:PD40 domain-containing protein [candidate division KSB1 bacterium]|nr:PD40 domain-containing protein [candidate division KSB1 bacterium]
MKRSHLYFIPLFILLGCITAVQAQYFGKNKVQYTDFDWHYLQSEHFDIYFTDGGEDLAVFVAKVAETSYRSLQKSLRYSLDDRLKIIVHNSHNDFQQTNVDLSAPEESVGGFTEFFKNRVVVPFEGEWEKFRHVIHHEVTHAVMLQMAYGSGVQSIISGMTQMQLPLWFVEGLAEFQSLGWDIDSDMYMRDATVNGYLPPIPYLSAFLAYKGGQSVLRYLSDRYGEEKVGELLGKVKIHKNFDRGLKQAIGIETEDLTKRWQRYMKRQYWPDIEDRKEPEEFSKRLTDHRKDGSFVNNSPAVSNRGDKLAFKSDKSNYFDIYLMSAIDGRVLKKLVKGQRAGNLEELQWLRGPGISWSPDDRQIAFTAKAGGQDALYIVDVKKSKIVKSYEFDLDGVYNPAWSPEGDEIAFSGLKNGQSDIYTCNLKTGQLRKITDDVYSDVEPRWSPDGGKLVFVSDRSNFNAGVIPVDLVPTHFNMKNLDIYEINSDGSDLRPVIESNYIERSPSYSRDGKFLLFTSERAGISNIYLKNLQTEQEWPITNVLTGAFQPSWGGSNDRLVYSAFFYAGYDLYQLKNPLDIKPGDLQIKETEFVRELREGKRDLAAEEMLEEAEMEKPAPDRKTQQYRDFVFDESFAEGKIKEDEKKKVALDSSDYILPTGDFKVHDYEVKLSADLIYGTVGYSQFFGTQGMTNILLSDVLGNHRLSIGLNVFGDFRNADYALTYFYLPKRLDIGTGLFHNAYYFYSNFGWIRDRNYGFSLYLSNPFNKFERVSYGMTAMGINRSYLEWPDDLVDTYINEGLLPPRDRFFILNNLSYTRDTAIWGWTGPFNGNRMEVGVTYSPGLGENGIDFVTFRGDWRKYYRLGREYNFAVRFSGGFSEGKNKQKFFLGGLPNWLNQDFYDEIYVEHIEDIYFASFEMPLRGADYWQLGGNRFLLTNLEFRFPLVRRLSMGFPLPLDLWNVGGALFTDMGLAWDKGDQVKPFVKSPNGFIETRDVFASIGIGARMNLGFLLLRLDLAWPTTLYRTAKSPQVLWSLGADF